LCTILVCHFYRYFNLEQFGYIIDFWFWHLERANTFSKQNYVLFSFSFLLKCTLYLNFFLFPFFFFGCTRVWRQELYHSTTWTRFPPSRQLLVPFALVVSEIWCCYCQLDLDPAT
jgi:hypothetical protein